MGLGKYIRNKQSGQVFEVVKMVGSDQFTGEPSHYVIRNRYGDIRGDDGNPYAVTLYDEAKYTDWCEAVFEAACTNYVRDTQMNWAVLNGLYHGDRIHKAVDAVIMRYGK